MAKQQRTKSQTASKPRPKRYRFNKISMIKTVTMGPAIAALAVIALYCAWWGLSSIFNSLHAWTKSSFLPWMKENWWILLIIWAIIIISSVVYFIFEENKRKTPRESSPVHDLKNEEKEEEQNQVWNEEEDIFTMKDVERNFSNIPEAISTDF